MSTPPWGQEPEQPTPPAPPPSPYGQPPPSPYGQQPASPYQPYGGPPSPYGAYPVTKQTNGMAIASLIVSIGSVVFCCGLPGIVGAILGHVARKQIREQNQAGEGMALAGVIVGWAAFAIGLGLVILYIVLIIVGVVASDSVDCYTDTDGVYTCD
jgi:hypothetical protein